MLDPVTFQQKFLRRHLWDKQKQICRAIASHRSVSIKGCHGSGKTFVVSGMIPWECSGQDEAVVLWMAPTLRQVKTGWGEVIEAIGKVTVSRTRANHDPVGSLAKMLRARLQ